MIIREIQQTVINLSKTYPVVTITGPRQAGKTTLAKMAFPGYTYSNLEHPETRRIAEKDPNTFFNQYPAPLIIDEIQRVPELLSYIQVHVDEAGENGMYILTGSQQLSVNASISQSLAGRTALVTLLPFSIKELGQINKKGFTRDQYLYHGFMPRIYDQHQEPTISFRNYLHTYVERDIRQLINIKNLYSFENFLRLLAARVGQLVNLSSLSNDSGVSTTTISQWLSVLEASFIIFRLNPYYKNYGKRIIKAPKIYFIEPGLVTYLLGIEDEKQVSRDPLIGSLFENMVVIEALKSRTNKGLDSNLFFFRDSHHNEVDLLYKKANHLVPVEIKSSTTYNDDFVKGVQKFQDAIPDASDGYVVYGGKNCFTAAKNINVLGFEQCGKIF